ncbi:MAG: MFS transporter [SAR324 cluster bacterium]|nr:MFS transporter [SAR324 cluster bacterium]
MYGILPYRSPWLSLVVVCLGLGLLLIDLFAVNVALPAIGRSLGADLSEMEWIITVYVLMLGVFPVVMGRLGDLLGRRRTFLAGLFLFILASLACGMATDIRELIAFRALQGLGASIMMPLSLTLVTAAFPASQRGLAVGIWDGVSGLGLIAGPLVGGFLVHGDDWRWIFLINLPVGLVALLATRLFVEESKDFSASGRIDWMGAGLLSGGLFLLIIAFFLVREAGWVAVSVLGSFAGSALILALFVMVERRSQFPLIDLSLFRNTTFLAATASVALFSAAVFGMQPFLSLLMQNTWDFTPLQGGLGFLPATALVAATMPVAGWLAGKLGRRLRLAIMGGSLAVLVSSLLLAALTPASGYMDGLLPAFLIRGIGIGIVISTTTFAAVSALPAVKIGLASGILTMARQVGTAGGIALLGSVYLGSIEEGWGQASGLASNRAALAAVRMFQTVGDGPLQSASNALIVSGFVQIALAAATLCALATVAALFIRHRAPAEEPDVAPLTARTEATAVPGLEVAAGSKSG